MKQEEMFAFLIILILIVGSTHGATVNVAASESDNSTVAVSVISRSTYAVER